MNKTLILSALGVELYAIDASGETIYHVRHGKRTHQVSDLRRAIDVFWSYLREVQDES